MINSPWRRVAAVLYTRPRESKVFGSVDLDVTVLEQFIAEKRAGGLKITLTHVLLLGLARGIRDKVPEFNTFVRRGSIIQRPQLDASLSVLIPGSGEMSALKVPHLEQLTLSNLAEFLSKQLRDMRSEYEDPTAKIRDKLAAIPWPFRGWVVGFASFLTMNLGLHLPGLGLSNDRFGCFLLSNIGSIGLDVGYPALFPNSNLTMVVNMGQVQTKPVFEKGAFVPKRIITISAAIDHRLVDGVHIGKLFMHMKQIVATPALLDDPS
ncbi:MAG: 2-oxo acid dehydrogenase subunit E2 [Saprospiraceae bacterium]|nr:2-oxo acid dehydrogenase subunit E2 [Saprospiraceae bacterium]